MKTLVQALSMIAIFASAVSAVAQVPSRLEDLHTKVETYCLYYKHDQLCGGPEAEMKTRQQRDARNVIDQSVVDWSEEILSARATYEETLRGLNQAYLTTDDSHRATIRIVAAQLNRAWLSRFQPEVDYWLSSSAEGNQNGIVMGWLIYAVAFTSTPEFKNVPVLHKFLRARLPWSVFAVSAVGLGGYRAYAHSEAARPQLPAPPFFLLSFGEKDEPGEDFAAQMEHQEFLKFREMFASNAGLMALVAAGPSAATIARGTTIAGRLAYIGGKLMSSTRFTPVSLIVGWIVSESASWTYTQYRWTKLIQNFQSVVEGQPNTAQELSTSLNGLHILYLGELDQQLRDEEKARALLLNDEGDDDKKTQKEFLALAMQQKYFRGYNVHRVDAELDVYLTAQQDSYRKFAKFAVKLADYMSAIPVNSDLKRDIILRRVQHLRNQAKTAEQNFAAFPRDVLSRKIKALFPHPYGANPGGFYNAR